MKKFIFILFMLISTLSFSEEYINGKILKKIGSANENSYLHTKDITNEDVKDIVYYTIKLKNSNKIVEVEQAVYNDESLNFDFKVGDKVILMKDIDEDNNEIYYVTDIDKKGSYIALSIIFLLLTAFIAKSRGIKGLLSLLVSLGTIFYFFLPMVIKGYSPIILSVIAALFSSIVTILFIAGFSRKGAVAILGSIGGVLFSGLLSLYFVHSMGLTGYTTVDAVGYSGLLAGIKLKELISAGIILGSMGAIMDVAMSISSSISEIKEVSPNLKPWNVFLSGINIGQDIIGTMINTLVLAYVGGSLFDILIIAININELTMARLFNFEFIAVEILKSFSGSIGIVIAIPLTAYLGAYLSHDKIKKK